MLAVLYSLGMFIVDLFKSRCRLEAENLFLRHQLSITLRRVPVLSENFIRSGIGLLRSNRRIITSDVSVLWSFASFVVDLFKSRRRLEAENLLLRHQLNVALRDAPRRLRLRGVDRAVLVGLVRFWPDLARSVRVVKPETVLHWYRMGFCAYWRWKSQKRAGRPKIDHGLRDLIRRMSQDNPLWGASRIHG